MLRQGSIVGIRSPDWGGFLIALSDSELDEAIAYYKLLQQRNEGNPYIGRYLRALLREAGFTNIKASATYECYYPLSSIAKYLAVRSEASRTLDKAVGEEWTDERSSTVLSCALRKWSHHPDGFFAQAWCEAVGQKD